MLDAPYLAGCVLLVAAGFAKARQPADTARAVRQVLGLVRTTERGVGRLVALLAAAELLVGLAGLLAPSATTAVLVAASYAGFSVFVLVALVRGGPVATCGCLGKADTPPTITHVALTLGIAASAATVAARARPGFATLWSFLGHQPLDGVPMLLSSCALAFVGWLALARLPALRGAR